VSAKYGLGGSRQGRARAAGSRRTGHADGSKGVAELDGGKRGGGGENEVAHDAAGRPAYVETSPSLPPSKTHRLAAHEPYTPV
jgi:hypothetical protein